MEQQGVIREITRIANPVARSLGLEVWGVEIVPSGRMVVRIYVDTQSGIRDVREAETDTGGRGPDIGQCAKISRYAGLALDAEGIIPHAYVLEVSSPGLERPFFTLAQLAPYVGRDLDLKLGGAQPELPDRKRLRGRLLAVGEHGFTLLAYDAPEGTRLSIRWDNVRKVTLAPVLPCSHIAKPGKKKSAPKADATSK